MYNNSVDKQNSGTLKISLKDSEYIDKGEFGVQFYATKEDGLPFSALMVDVKGRHYLTKMKGASRIYLVTEGKGTFILDDKEESAEKGDLFVIKDGHKYEYTGNMKLFEINIPGTDQTNQENLDLKN